MISAGVHKRMPPVSIDISLLWSGESRPGEDFYGISIALAIHSLDQSLFIPLISYKEKKIVCIAVLLTWHSAGVRKRASSVSIDIALRCSAGNRDLEKIPIALPIQWFDLLQGEEDCMHCSSIDMALRWSA